MKTIKLSEWAVQNSYTYNGAYLKYKRGAIPNSFSDEDGSIFVNINDETGSKVKKGTAVLYSRCSSSKQRDDAVRQLERLEKFTTSRGLAITNSYIEIASGMNEDRKILNKILERNDFEFLVVENKDRLTRYGYKYIELFLKSKGITILVLNETKTDQDELMIDLVSVITSFCARLYGKRRSLNKKEKIVKIINDKE